MFLLAVFFDSSKTAKIESEGSSIFRVKTIQLVGVIPQLIGFNWYYS